MPAQQPQTKPSTTCYSINRTHNPEAVRAILSYSDIWEHVKDDGVSSPLDLDIPITDKFYYLIPMKGNDVCGLFIAHPLNMVTYQIHIAILPRMRGDTVNIGKLCLEWMFENTSSKKLVGFIPEDNKKTIALSQRVGMTKEGVLKKSILKDGKLKDQIIFSIGG